MTTRQPAELERIVRVRNLPAGDMVIEADEAERAQLAARFGICAIHALTARVALEPDGPAVRATGSLIAEIEQECTVSSERFGTRIEEPIDLLFVPEIGGDPASFDEEVELAADDLDRIGFTGDSFDLGEAVAQTLGLAIDPYAEGPDADAVRTKAGIVADDVPTGPLAAALAALKRD